MVCAVECNAQRTPTSEDVRSRLRACAASAKAFDNERTTFLARFVSTAVVLLHFVRFVESNQRMASRAEPRCATHLLVSDVLEPVPDLDGLRDYRWQATCAGCGRRSVPVASPEAEGAWEVLKKIGWRLSADDVKAVCPRCARSGAGR